MSIFTDDASSHFHVSTKVFLCFERDTKIHKQKEVHSQKKQRKLNKMALPQLESFQSMQMCLYYKIQHGFIEDLV